MKLIKKYIIHFILHNTFLRNKVKNFQYFKETIDIADSLTSSVLNFNNYIENKHEENFINILDIGCFGQIPDHLTKLKNFNFYGIDIDTEEINRQKKRYKGKNFNFFNYKVIEPSNLSKLRQNFIEPESI